MSHTPTTGHTSAEGPLVSVVVPAYQAAATLGATLASILDQDHTHLEVLVVDDGSTDGTADLAAAAAAADPRVRVLGDGVNRGRSAARNAGLDAAQGDWVAMVDADDLLARDRISAFLEATRQFPDTNLVTDDRIGWRLDDGGRVRVEHRSPGRHTWRLGPPHRLDPRRHFTDRFGHVDFMVRRSFLDWVGVRYPTDMAIGEDLVVDNTLLFAPGCFPVRVARPSYYYRLAPTSRAAGGPQAHAQMVERVGSPELSALYRRWEPAHSWLFDRADRQLAAEGRLGAIQVEADRYETHPSRWAGGAMLVGLKVLQWLSRWEDRHVRDRIAADITAQLARSVGGPPPGLPPG
jgi:hypothetical protein